MGALGTGYLGLQGLEGCIRSSLVTSPQSSRYPTLLQAFLLTFLYSDSRGSRSFSVPSLVISPLLSRTSMRDHAQFVSPPSWESSTSRSRPTSSPVDSPSSTSSFAFTSAYSLFSLLPERRRSKGMHGPPSNVRTAYQLHPICHCRHTLKGTEVLELT